VIVIAELVDEPNKPWSAPVRCWETALMRWLAYSGEVSVSVNLPDDIAARARRRADERV